MMRTRSFLWPLFLAAACGSGADPVIGTEGGRVTVDQGRLVLEFPAGALASKTPIHVERSDRGGLNPGYALGPDGLTFAHPVRMTVNVGAALDADKSRIAKLHDDGNYELDGDRAIDQAAGTVSASLVGFSTHGVTVVLCPNGCPMHAADLTATPEQDGRMRLAWGLSGGGGGVERFYIERAEYPGLAGPADVTDFKFLAWTPDATREFYDSNLCKTWTYRYRVRSFAVSTIDDALSAPTAIALSSSQTACAAPPAPDAGMMMMPASPGQEGMRGTIVMRNLYALPLTLIEQGETPGAANLVQHNGSRLVAVDPTPGARSTFQVLENGAMVGQVTCTVGQYAWPDGIVGPEVVVQPTKRVDCLDW